MCSIRLVLSCAIIFEVPSTGPHLTVSRDLPVQSLSLHRCVRNFIGRIAFNNWLKGFGWMPPHRKKVNRGEEEGRHRPIQINYIDSYDYKVVVNIKIILQSLKEARLRSAEKHKHKHNRPNYVIDYKWSKLHLRVFYGPLRCTAGGRAPTKKRSEFFSALIFARAFFSPSPSAVSTRWW